MENVVVPSLIHCPLSILPLPQASESRRAYHKALLGDNLILVEASKFSGLPL